MADLRTSPACTGAARVSTGTPVEHDDACRVTIACLRGELDTERARVANLETALTSARTIGAAVGIVMSALKIGQDEAFALLSRMSQVSNRKLRDVADDVVYTGLVTGPEAATG